MRVNEPTEPWPCDWAGAELAQLRRDAACSFRDNLIWLEEMTEFAERFSKAPFHQQSIEPMPSGKK
jgi:hypothetical protein